MKAMLEKTLFMFVLIVNYGQHIISTDNFTKNMNEQIYFN